MRILVVSENFYPDNFAINGLVEKLTSLGHKVTVLTGLPDYTTSEIPEEYKHGKNRRQHLFGADVIRVSTIPRKHGAIWRSLNYISFVVTGSMAARFRKWDSFDIIYVWEVSPVTMAVPAIILKKRYKKPLLLYCLDIWPECIKAMGFKENSFVFRVVKNWSSKIYNQCDHIAVSSRPFFNYLEEVDGCDRAKMSYLPQYAPSELTETDYFKIPNNHYDFLYIGNIGKAQKFEWIINAAEQFKDRNDVSFHIVGGGTSFAEMKELACTKGISNMVFYGPKSFAESAEFYKKSDACLLTLDGSNHIGDTLPGKLQTYMAAGKPIIACANGAAMEVIKESECGFCAEAGNWQEFAGCIEAFIQNIEQSKKWAENARTYFLDHFTEQKHMDNLVCLMNQLDV